jgi:hypothetical protein
MKPLPFQYPTRDLNKGEKGESFYRFAGNKPIIILWL